MAGRREYIHEGTITVACGYCGESITAPNKGLGRAKLAVWESRHQPGHNVPAQSAATTRKDS